MGVGALTQAGAVLNDVSYLFRIVPATRPGDLRLLWRCCGPCRCRRRQLGTALQPRDDEMQELESELRVLEIQFLDLIVTDPGGLDVGLAAHGHGPATF